MKKLKGFLRRLKTDIKEYPSAYTTALMSFFFIGLGQFRNKQWYKAVPLIIIFLIYVLFEIGTSGYIYALQGETQLYPADVDGQIYFFRDYGGFITKGLWGLFSLGTLVLGDSYRGQNIKTFDPVLTWVSADRSIDLLGNGIITIVLLTFLVAFWIYSIVDAYKTRKTFIETGEIESGIEYISRVWQSFFAYIIMIPAITLMMFFTIIPFLFAFLIAFTNYTYKIQTSVRLIEWVGFDTFAFIFENPDWYKVFLKIFLWTIIWAFASSITVYIVGFFQALVVQSQYTVGKKVWRILLILPWAIPAMISLMVFKNAFDKDGLINTLLLETNTIEAVNSFLRTIGLLGQEGTGIIYWFSDTANGSLARTVIILVNLWLGAPYFMMLIVGVLNTIPRSLYEAAEIDGANAFQKFKHITLPKVLAATLPVIIMTFSFNFNNFGAIYFLTGGSPNWVADAIPESMRITGAMPGQTDILISWIYKLSFTDGSEFYNIASVYSILIFLVVGGFSIFNLARAKNFWEED